MVDQYTLSLIKPKRLYEDKSCFIVDGVIEMELGATKIIAPFLSKLPSVEIKVKDLWSGNLDAATTTKFKGSKLPTPGNWLEIPISVADVTVFSSISSVGEDTFFSSLMSCGYTDLKIEAYGLSWATKYKSPKVMNNGTRAFYTAFDWYLYYYLFQMFKELTGKKIGTLLWQEDVDNVYFTNQMKEYYIICSKKNPILLFKDKLIPEIDKFFKKDSSPISSTKKLLAETAEPELKHLLRPFGDVLKVEDFDYHKKYSSDNYTVYFTKEKK